MWIPKTDRCAFLVDNLDLEAATGVADVKFEYFQLAFLQNDSMFGLENKSRQVAFSWTCAAEAVAEGILEGISSVFVSINLDEAKEKIRYARQIIAALPPGMQPGLVTDNRTELEFTNHARLISLPATPPRGKARMNVYLDEYAHVRDDAVIYTAALPMISKGGRLRIGSSPMGASGRFWEIDTQTVRPYPGYTRRSTPWWETFAFCIDVRAARKMAPTLTTEQRVARFGNERIRTIFANMPLEDFQQEYECLYVDETTAWITWDEIKAAQETNLVCFQAVAREKDLATALAAVDDLAKAVRDIQVEQHFTGGMDVGRVHNTSEIYLVGLPTVENYPLRLMLSLGAMDFDDQRDVLIYLLQRLPVVGLLIDRTGIGRNLAETMEKIAPGRVAGVDFTNPSKLQWATDAKTLIQQRKTPIPVDKELAYQIHSIKRIVTAARNLVFDTARNEKHHADRFWAWALALAAAKLVIAPPETQVVVQEELVSISPV